MLFRFAAEVWNSISVRSSDSLSFTLIPAERKRQGTECDRCVIVAFSAKLCWLIHGASVIKHTSESTHSATAALSRGPGSGPAWGFLSVYSFMLGGPGSGQEAGDASLLAFKERRKKRRMGKSSWSTTRTNPARLTILDFRSATKVL